MDEMVRNFYAANPLRLHALQLLFPGMNPNGYDPHIPATLQGFADPLTALENAGIPFNRNAVFVAADQEQQSKPEGV